MRTFNTFKSLIIGVGLLSLNACSSLQFGYGQGQRLTYWWLDGYVDFQAEQSPRAKAAIAQWFGWHRKTQLSDYADWLKAVQAEALRPTTAQRLCQLAAQARGKLDLALLQAAPHAAALALEFTPAQIKHLQDKQARGNAEFVNDFIKGPAEQRLEKRAERAAKRLGDYYGPLTDAQRAALAENLAASPFSAEVALAERKARQRDVVDTLTRIQREASGSVPQAQAVLTELIKRIEHSPRADYAAYEARQVAHECQSVARLHNLATPEQREQLRDKLRTWEQDLRALAASPG
jgi:Family of unknown function (DUF6279)